MYNGLYKVVFCMTICLLLYCKLKKGRKEIFPRAKNLCQPKRLLTIISINDHTGLPMYYTATHLYAFIEDDVEFTLRDINSVCYFHLYKDVFPLLSLSLLDFKELMKMLCSVLFINVQLY